MHTRLAATCLAVAALLSVRLGRWLGCAPCAEVEEGCATSPSGGCSGHAAEPTTTPICSSKASKSTTGCAQAAKPAAAPAQAAEASKACAAGAGHCTKAAYCWRSGWSGRTICAAILQGVGHTFEAMSATMLDQRPRAHVAATWTHLCGGSRCRLLPVAFLGWWGAWLLFSFAS
jgi:hypothetical protein